MSSVLPRADRFSDERTDDPYWNESVWFSISKPEERLHGLIQYYFRPNMGIDHFMAATFPAQFSHHGPRAHEGVYAHPVDDSQPEGPLRWSFGKNGEQAFRALHEWVAAASRQGCNIIIDHLMMIDPPVLQDAIWRMKDLPVLFVVLKPPYEVLEQRVATRKMGKRIPVDPGDDLVRRIVERLHRLRPWFYEAVYANECCDLEIDTSKCVPEEACVQIEQRLASGPGTAFEQLRSRYAAGGSREE
jgi:chloramphenicol 3-O-phosphotransferase